MEQETLVVTGMMCAHCEKAVEKAISAIEGVTSVTADHAGGTVEVTYDPAFAKHEQFASAIEAAGYSVVA